MDARLPGGGGGLVAGAETRHHPRVRTTLVVQVRARSSLRNVEFTPALVGDVSEGGAKVMVRGGAPLPERVQIQFYFPRDLMRIRVAGHLRWERAVGRAARVAGYEFLPLSPFLRRQLLASVGRQDVPAEARRGSAAGRGGVEVARATPVLAAPAAYDLPARPHSS